VNFEQRGIAGGQKHLLRQLLSTNAINLSDDKKALLASENIADYLGNSFQAKGQEATFLFVAARPLSP
jgi:hypothetical protein